MAKALKIVAIAGAVVATVATAGAASPTLLAALGTTAATMTSVAAIASIAAVTASIGAQALIKPPPARGSVTQVIVDPNAPQPYVMGEGYYAGVLRYDRAYGAAIKKIPNPYRFMVVVYSGGGPIQEINPRVDFAAPSSWYTGFLYTDTQLGDCPEGSALAPQWAGAPGWDAASKLSGYAAIGWSMLFDKDGKVFSSGLPLLGAYGKWVKVYDPRKDSTQPGGSGSHRLGDEDTYEWSEWPALHAGTYAYGRYQNGKRTFGMGLPADGIDWAAVAAWANVCEANNWTMFGVIYEGVGAGESERRWDNLKDICFAGGAEPILGGVLTFKYSAPTVALDTITMDDLTDDDASVVTMQTYRDRINTVIPKYRSEDHNWELVDGEAVVNSTFLTEDGEAKREVWPFNFVKNVEQATQLAAYRMFDSREIPVTLVCKPRLRNYRPGECLYLDLPELGLEIEAIILRRLVDPVSMTVTFELLTETTAKHAYCLGQTGTAPPTPALNMTGEDRDIILAAAAVPSTIFRQDAAPTVFRDDDEWYDTNDGNRHYIADAGVWEEVIDQGAASARNGLLTDGTVTTDKVVTSSIVDDAVSETGFSFTASGVLLPNSGYIDVQSLVVTADGENPVILQASFAFYFGSDNADGDWAIYRDSTPLAVFDPVRIASGQNITASAITADTPVAGTYTYYIKAKANDNLDIGVKNRALLQIRLKK